MEAAPPQEGRSWTRRPLPSARTAPSHSPTAGTESPHGGAAPRRRFAACRRSAAARRGGGGAGRLMGGAERSGAERGRRREGGGGVEKEARPGAKGGRSAAGASPRCPRRSPGPGPPSAADSALK